jgi:peptidyl-prolyl cis-trans isomerase A (cyclophilin A)
MRRALFLLLGAALLACPGPRRASAGPDRPALPAKPRVLIRTSMGDITVELWPRVAPHTVKVFLGLAEGKGDFTDVADPKLKVHITHPFYDGLTFHRVIKGFMAQAGCPNGDGTGDAGFHFADEINGKRLGLDKQKVLKGNQPHPWLGIRTQADWERNVLVPLLKSMKIDLYDAKAQRARQDDIKARLANLTLYDLYRMQGYKYDDTLPSVPPRKGNIALANMGPNTNSSQFFLNLADTPWLTGRHTVFGTVVAGMKVLEAIGNVPVNPKTSRPLTPVKIVSIRRVKP